MAKKITISEAIVQVYALSRIGHPVPKEFIPWTQAALLHAVNDLLMQRYDLLPIQMASLVATLSKMKKQGLITRILWNTPSEFSIWAYIGNQRPLPFFIEDTTQSGEKINA